ncbi:flippase [Halovivax asiaticus]|nr:flippase [Halovivax asiaticus]
MSLRRELLGRFQFELVARIVGSISGALLTVGLARILSTDEYGLLFLAISVFGVIELISRLGIPKAGARYITQYREKDPDQIPGLLRYIFLLNIAVAFIASSLLFVGSGPISQAVNEPELAILLLLGTVFVTSSAVFKFSRIQLQAFEDINSAAVIYALERGIRASTAIGLAIIGYGAVGALIGYILASVIGGIIGVGILYRRYFQGETVLSLEKGLRTRVVRYSVPITATSAANTIDKKIDTILVGFFLDPIAVAFYTLPRQIISFIQTPVSALGFSLSPTFESQKASGNAALAARIYEKSLFHILLIYIPAAAGIVLVAEPFISIIFGPDYSGAIPVLQILALQIVLLAVAILTSNSLDYLGRARERAIAKTITALLNLLLNILLIPTIGVVGAAISTVTTFSIYTFVSIYIMAQELEIRLNWLFWRVGKIIVITLIMSPFVYAMLLIGEGALSLLLSIIVGTAIWFGGAVLLRLIDLKKLAEKVS